MHFVYFYIMSYYWLFWMIQYINNIFVEAVTKSTNTRHFYHLPMFLRSHFFAGARPQGKWIKPTNLERSMEKWEWMTLKCWGKVRINHLTPKIFAHRAAHFWAFTGFRLRLCCPTMAHQLVERSQWLPQGCACLAPTPGRYVTIPIIFLDHFKISNHTLL